MQQLHAAPLGREFARRGNIISPACKEKKKEWGVWQEVGWKLWIIWHWRNKKALLLKVLGNRFLVCVCVCVASYFLLWLLKSGHIRTINIHFFARENESPVETFSQYFTRFPEVVMNIMYATQWDNLFFLKISIHFWYLNLQFHLQTLNSFVIKERKAPSSRHSMNAGWSVLTVDERQFASFTQVFS